MPPLTSSPPLLSRLYLSVLCNKIIKEDSALHCGRQRSPQTLETRISSLAHAVINLQQFPSHTVLYKTPGFSATLLQSPVMSNTRQSSTTQSVHYYFSFSPGPRFPAVSSSPNMISWVTSLWSPIYAEQRPRPQQPPSAHGCFDAFTSGSLEGVFVGDNAVVRQLAPDCRIRSSILL